MDYIKVQLVQCWQQWVKKRSNPGNPQTIKAATIYIMPSKWGWLFAVLVLSILTGAINYQISAIFLMTFLLAVIALISAWETHKNLLELSIQFIALDDTTQGVPAKLSLLVKSSTSIRCALQFQIGKQAAIRIEEIPSQGLNVLLALESPHRGYFLLPTITVSTVYPFGIFYAWSYLYFTECYYVYPKPVDPEFWPTPTSQEMHATYLSLGDEELYELKQTEDPWSAPKRIAWKIAAKGRGWYLKYLKAPQGSYYLFRLTDLPASNLEIKLQQMAFWLKMAEAKGYYYGVDLGDALISYGRGDKHLQHALRQLAIYQ